MFKLLSEAEDREIRDNIQMLANTFFDTPILYKLHTESMSIYNEDNEAQKFEEYELKALAEYGGDENSEKLQGSRDFDRVKLTLNLEDLERKGLINPDFTHRFQAEKDYFTCKGKQYKVTDVHYDAPLSRKDVLIIIEGRVSERPL